MSLCETIENKKDFQEQSYFSTMSRSGKSTQDNELDL